MSSFDKVIKGACKPKAAPPKSKYLDPIIAATWSDDGAIHDVCKALSPRFREPNVVVVFKALIVLHTMIRNGATDKVLSYLSTSDVLKLRNVSGGTWEGYSTPQNLQNYATYLDTRIRAFRDLKHDAIRVHSENNIDFRNSMAIEEDTLRREGVSPSNNYDRRKTIVGRKLKVMTVEKGLLRETKIVQKMINALVECRFYLDDLDDQLNITTLRMLVNDLMTLFQACNEGVVNVLEHYFEMSHVDASQALTLYRNFCKQTERVVEFLGVAKKLQNLLNVSIPNFKHAPVSLAGALEEYLNDPNFEQNRIEYKTSKAAVEKGINSGKQSTDEPKKDLPPTATPGSSSAKPSDNNTAIQDFFAAIEEQPTMFNPQTNSPNNNYFQQQASSNPFSAFGSQPVQTQPTGFLLQTAAFQPPQQHSPHNPFGHLQQQYQPSPLMQTQPTGFVQPQMTGLNPFRQNSLSSQTTGLPPFNSSQPFHGLANVFQPHDGGHLKQQPQQISNSSPFTFTPIAPTSAPVNTISGGTTFPPAVQQSSPLVPPPRPASAPLTSLQPMTSVHLPSEPAPPVKTHQTGSRNPFGVPTMPPPPVPKVPTLMELAIGIQQTNNSQSQPQMTGSNGLSLNGLSGTKSSPQSSAMSDVASDFSFLKLGEKSPSSFPNLGSSLSPQSTSGTAVSSSETSLPSLSTGTTFNTSSAISPSIPIGQTGVQSHVTGVFTGLKAFKPTSSFGAQLLETLPPIPQSKPGTPAPSDEVLPAFATSANNTSQTGSDGSKSNIAGTSSTFRSGFGALPTRQSSLGAQSSGLDSLSSQTTGAFGGNFFGNTSAASGGGSAFDSGRLPGGGLRPQMTGGVAGAANPFRASTFGGGPPTSQSNGTPLGASNVNATMFSNVTSAGLPPMGTSIFNPGVGTFEQNRVQQ